MLLSTEILLIGPLGTNFSETLIEIYIFSFKKMHLTMSSRNWQPFCPNLNVLKRLYYVVLKFIPPKNSSSQVRDEFHLWNAIITDMAQFDVKYNCELLV